MRSRSPSKRWARARGFTLVEVIVAAAIFSAVLVIAMSLINESTEVSRKATIQSDLRRVGEDILGTMIRDLRSTQAQYASGASNSNENSIEFYKITGFDTVAQSQGFPILEPNASAGNTPPTPPAGSYVYRYVQESTALTGERNPLDQTGILVLYRGAQQGSVSNFESQALRVEKCRELAIIGDTQPNVGTVNGFTVTVGGSAFPQNLLSAHAYDATAHFTDAPVIVTLKLVLKRRLGLVNNSSNFNRQFVWMTVQSQVELRPSNQY